MNEKDIIAQILNLDSNEIDEWIEKRVNLLENTAVEDREEISSISYVLRRARGEKENTEVQGYIPSKTKLKRMQFDIASFRMDDTSFYKNIINNIKKVNPDSIMKDGKINQAYIMSVVQCAIINYLGLYSNDKRRNELYNTKSDIDKKPLSIKDFKRNGTAMCLEKSSMAQNMLAFLGYDPMMIYGYLSNEKGNTNEGHAYNCIIRNGKAILIDFTNPILKDGEYYKPAMFAIDKNKLEDFKKGKAQIEVMHTNLHTNREKIEEEPIKLVYSSEEIDPKYFEHEKEQKEEVQEQPKTSQIKNKLNYKDISTAIFQAKVPTSDVQKQANNTDRYLKVKRLMETDTNLTAEEKALIEEYKNVKTEVQNNFDYQQKMNSSEISR